MQLSAQSDVVALSNRERRRLDTRGRIERHAVDLALQLGSAEVTVEAICELSAISVRSFYNYFESKDAAIVGEGPTLPSPDVLQRFATGAGPDIFSDLLDAVGESFTGLDGSSDLQRDRARLMRSEPELLESMGAQMARVREELIAVVLERLARGDSVQERDELVVRAVMIVELKSAVMKTALHVWARTPGSSFQQARVRAQALAMHTFIP